MPTSEDTRTIPEEQLTRTCDWMVSWNLIDAGHEVRDFINASVMTPEKV
jgi:hypothetical protein